MSEREALSVPDAESAILRRPSRRRRRVRTVVIAAVLAALVIAGATVGFLLHQRQLSQPVQYRTAVVRLGTITASLQISGNLQPADPTDVNFLVSGSVTAVDAKLGQQVAAGQTLATIDSTLLQNTLTTTQATLSAAQAALAQDDAVGATDLQIVQDQSQVTIAKVNVAQARAAVQEATLTAPVAGVIEQVNLAVGQQVGGGQSPSSGGSGEASGGEASGGAGAPASSAAATTSGSNPEFVIIPAGGPLAITGSVSDTVVDQLQVGQKAEVTPAGSSKAVEGTVTAIAPAATISSSGVATFPVTVQIPNPPSAPRPGTSASVQIITKQATDVPTVPTSALHSSGGRTTVEVLRHGRPQVVTVVTGISDAGETQILSGLEVGDVIVLATVSGYVPPPTFGGPGGGKGGG